MSDEASGPRRWVRYLMPVMVEVDCENDTVTRVVTLAEELRPDREDLGHFCVYDEKFVLRHSDSPPWLHAWSVSEPRWGSERFRVGPPVNWPEVP